MRVASIRVENFMRYGVMNVALPEAGLVILTGANGAGKSGVLEAVSTAVWGKTVRGTPPWPRLVADDGGRGVVHVKLGLPSGEYAVDRMRKGSHTTLRHGPHGAEWPAYETTTKAQEALARVVPTWDVWRRTCVLTSADSAHFTGATDAERKRLLESMLGLERYDRAHAAVKADLHAARAALQTAETKARVAETQVAERTAALAELEAAAPPVGAPDPSELVTRAEGLTAALAAERKSYDLRHRLRGGAINNELVAHRRLTDAQERLAALESQGACPTCGGRHHVDVARARLQGVVRDLTKLHEAAALHVTELEPLDRARLDKLAADESDAVIDAHMARAAFEAGKGHAERVQKARAGVDSAERGLGLAWDERDGAAHRVAELTAVEGVLSPAGVRGPLLESALEAVQVGANRWLGVLSHAGVRVRLEPYTERAGGGVKDAIALLVDGAGDGHGYRACSAGERRRLDVALLLALAEVARATSGDEPGTLWLDEVFDALDDDGADAVCAAVRELCRDRCVVVITHSPRLADALRTVPGRLVWVMNEGALHDES
jgi:DNA repair exonuclease SbcCD ATPase subunit